jgi:hypothetical protein
MDGQRDAITLVAAIRTAVRCEVRACILANMARKDEAIAADNAWWRLLTAADESPFVGRREVRRHVD